MKNATARQDAETYRQRRSISPAHGSSVRKLVRLARIEAGQRPLKLDRKFTAAGYANLPSGSPWQHEIAVWALAQAAGLKSTTEGTFARLHPTKGWRFGNAI